MVSDRLTLSMPVHVHEPFFEGKASSLELSSDSLEESLDGSVEESSDIVRSTFAEEVLDGVGRGGTPKCAIVPYEIQGLGIRSKCVASLEFNSKS